MRWFDRKQSSWIVKVRSSKAYLKVQASNTTLMRDQTIFFIPKFPKGRIQVDRIVQYQGGVPTGVPPTWTISTAFTQRLQHTYKDIAFVDPSTRSDTLPEAQLDIAQAAASLSPGTGTLLSLPYLQLEELLIRQGLPAETDWRGDQKFQHLLSSGVKPLYFISDDEPSKIRKLQDDIKAIQNAGLERVIRVLYPAPPFVTAESIKSTMATKIVNPKFFPITAIRLFDHPAIVTRTLGTSQKRVVRRFLLIEMDTRAGHPNFPVTLDKEQIHPEQQTTDPETRSKMAEHNLLVLVRKGDRRLDLLKSRRPSGCRLTSIRHPCHQTHVCLLLTFERPDQASHYLLANRNSSQPFYMLGASGMYHHPDAKTVITTRIPEPDPVRLVSPRRG